MRCSSAAKPRPRNGWTPRVSKKPFVTWAILTRVGWLPPDTDDGHAENSAMIESVLFCERRSSKFGSAKFIRWPSGACSHIRTILSGFGEGSGRNKTASKTENIALEAPTHTPKDN